MSPGAVVVDARYRGRVTSRLQRTEPDPQMLLATVVLLPFLLALLPAALERLRVPPAASAGLVAACAAGLLAVVAADVVAGDTVLASFPWAPTIGLHFALRLDGLSLLFAGLIVGIGLLVILYAHYYLADEDRNGRFFAYLLLFMGSMLGVVTADNLLLLLVFWELTGLSSFLLIGFWRGAAEARQGARLALFVTGAGGLALLAGVLLIGDIVGSFSLGEVLAAGDAVRADPRYRLVLALVLLGAFTKSAQFPFHFWLPHAMAAPTPVSAYLHSATMVKAGIFLLMRLWPVLAGTEEWFWAVSGVGLVTMLFGAYIALFQHDLKGLLAYSTISQLGLITLLLGLGTPLAEIAAVFHVMNHAIFKASLFMSAGIIDHETGTRDMRRLSGLARYMPVTAALAIVAAAAMAGVPLLNGFISKEMFFAETFALPLPWSWLMPLAATLGGLFSVAYAARFVHDVFFGGAAQDLPRKPHEPPRFMRVPIEILVGICLLVGLWPALAVEPSLRLAAAALLQGPLPEFLLVPWHGFNLPFAMSLVALAGGIALYFARRYLWALHGDQPRVASGKGLTEAFLRHLTELSAWLHRALDRGGLRLSLLALILTVLVAGWFAFIPGAPAATRPQAAAGLVGGLALAVVLLGSAATVLLHRERLPAVVSIGVIGLLVSLVFVKLSAPDLALTQLLVEVITVLLLLLAMYFLPQRSPRESSASRRLVDGLLALAAGAGSGALALAMLRAPADSISGYYLDQAKPGGGGYNVVNVILVDFRALDTLGEITVLGIAAVAIVAILDRIQLPPRQLDWDGRAWASGQSLLLEVLSRPLLPMALLVSVYLLLRGHNLPGGGFIAGLVTGTAILVQYLAHGNDWVEARLPPHYTSVAATGIAIATLTGLAALAFDAPFLTSTFTYLSWPVVGKFEVASAMVFDLGVYVAVIGVVLSILATIGRQHDVSREG
jgi:multicomponent K+:H+ antiporter subunit A